MGIVVGTRSMLLAAVAGVLVMDGAARAQATRPAAAGPAEFSTMSLEDLMNVQVTSVSKTEQSVATAPAAISVITGEDIRRSGMESIPEVLRLSPGLDVARVNGNQWAISSRGFNSLYANKLLVVVDGRTIYQPLFSGVYWDTVDYVLPDVDRIEVIRGPGATLWGANAVNGVINIMTKPADQTQGWLTTDGYSTDGYNAAVRYGGQIDKETFFRVYGKATDTGNDTLVNGSEAFDGSDTWRTGFRLDRYSTKDDTLTLQGDFFENRSGATYKDFVPTPVVGTPEIRRDAGQYVLGRWKHVVSKESDWTLQAYVDRFHEGDANLVADEYTADVDFQHRFPLGTRQEVMWGLGARYQPQSFRDGRTVQIRPTETEDYILSSFVQDDVTLSPELLHVILGTKVEQNSRTGFECEPSIKGVLTPTKRQTYWASASRAIRMPSQVEDAGSHIDAGTTPVAPGVAGSLSVEGTDVQSEDLTAFELGYRVRPADRLTVDVAGFANFYKNLIGFRYGTPFFDPTATPPHMVVPLSFDNVESGQTYGVETAATWNVTDEWKVVASHTFLASSLHSDNAQDDASLTTQEHLNPSNQFQLRTYYNVTRHLEFNAAAYYVEAIDTDVPSYVRVDLGMTWKPKDGLEVSVGLQNLLDNRHPEFEDGRLGTRASEIPRTLYAQMTWRF